MMPDGVPLRDVEDGCTALYHTLVDLTPIIVLTWPPGRQPSLGTEGGQPPAREQQLHLKHMGETEHKWYLKQHEFTTSLQRYVCSLYLPILPKLLTVRMKYRNLSRLTLLAQRVVEDPDAAYRGNVLERISQFTEKFEDLALRLKVCRLLSCGPSITSIKRASIHSSPTIFGLSKSAARVCAMRRGVLSLRLSRYRRMIITRQISPRCVRTSKR